jgi:hypothetical protein
MPARRAAAVAGVSRPAIANKPLMVRPAAPALSAAPQGQAAAAL